MTWHDMTWHGKIMDQISVMYNELLIYLLCARWSRDYTLDSCSVYLLYFCIIMLELVVVGKPSPASCAGRGGWEVRAGASIETDVRRHWSHHTTPHHTTPYQLQRRTIKRYQVGTQQTLHNREKGRVTPQKLWKEYLYQPTYHRGRDLWKRKPVYQLIIHKNSQNVITNIWKSVLVHK